jgi:uncharacterized protein YecE (DUF72 family)
LRLQDTLIFGTKARMPHGTKSWYNYVYSEKELKSILDKLEKKSGLKEAVYFNNDHGMLPNGKYILDHIL